MCDHNNLWVLVAWQGAMKVKLETHSPVSPLPRPKILSGEFIGPENLMILLILIDDLDGNHRGLMIFMEPLCFSLIFCFNPQFFPGAT